MPDISSYILMVAAKLLQIFQGHQRFRAIRAITDDRSVVGLCRSFDRVVILLEAILAQVSI